MAQTKLRNTQIEEGGWTRLQSTLTFNSVDNPTGVVNMASANTILSPGMRIRFVNSGNTIYGIVVAVTSTTFTFLHEINPANNLAKNLMQNSAITEACYSVHKAPFGFPVSPSKWSLFFTFIDTPVDVSGPIEGTYYNISNTQFSIPIGLWNLRMKIQTHIRNTSGNFVMGSWGLSVNKSSFSLAKSHIQQAHRAVGCTQIQIIEPRYMNIEEIECVNKTTLYLLVRADHTVTAIGVQAIQGSPGQNYLLATCAYL